MAKGAPEIQPQKCSCVMRMGLIAAQDKSEQRATFRPGEASFRPHHPQDQKELRAETAHREDKKSTPLPPQKGNMCDADVSIRGRANLGAVGGACPSFETGDIQLGSPKALLLFLPETQAGVFCHSLEPAANDVPVAASLASSFVSGMNDCYPFAYLGSLLTCYLPRRIPRPFLTGSSSS